MAVSQVGSRHGKKLSGDHTGPHCPEEQERLWEKANYWLIIQARNGVFGEQLQGRLVEAIRVFKLWSILFWFFFWSAYT